MMTTQSVGAGEEDSRAGMCTEKTGERNKEGETPRSTRSLPRRMNEWGSNHLIDSDVRCCLEEGLEGNNHILVE